MGDGFCDEDDSIFPNILLFTKVFLYIKSGYLGMK